MKLKIEIDMGNSAFGDDEYERGTEASRILRQVSHDMEANGLPEGRKYKVHDYNGNPVGTVEVLP